MTTSLKLLGGMALQDSDRPLTGRIAQRRRLAFLAILGVARSPVSRDRLVAILWPELDAEGARHRLSDSVYVARRALGESAIETPGDDVWLDDAQVEVDVRAFERALDEGALDRAVALYAGAFLDGFHLTEAGEFERWVDEERARLTRRFAQALRTLVTDAERRGDFAAAADSLRRLSAVDPLDASVTLRLMSALERAGDGAGALRQARIHQTLRHAELGLGEDADVRRASDELTARLESSANARPPVAADSKGQQEAVADESPRDPSRRIRVRVVAAAAVALVALGGWWTYATRRSPETTPGDEPTQMGVAVFPFTDRGATTQDVSGEAMAILLATKLDGGAGWRSIDPNALLAQYRPGDSHPDPADAARLAHRLGARYFVLGDVVRATGTIYLGAALYDASTGEPVSTRVGAQGTSSAVFELVDSLATRLLVGRRDEPAPQLARLASMTTSSLPALKEYLEGEAKLRDGQYLNAADHFDRAARIDTTFALAYYRLAWAHGWNAVRDDGRPLDLAARYGTRLPERFRLTLDAMSARRRGDDAEAERLLRAVVARYPDDFDATYELGDLLFHGNPRRGRDATEAREPLERAASLDPTRSAEALFHLISIASIQRRRDAVDSLATRFLLLHPAGELSITVRPIVAVVRRDTLRISQVGSELA
ncbi:MAG TPA: BTAD domain-containing putative transcriptional regulator, partial [Gemmatimonadaceae bacterium]